MQQNDDEALTVKPCDICGGDGYPEVIVTCSKFIACELFSKKIPDVWFCDSCQSNDGTTSPCKVNQDFDLQPSKSERTDGVIKVSSGNFRVKPIPASSNFLMTRKAYLGSKNVIPKIPSLALKSNPCISPMVYGKLPRSEAQKNHASHSSSKGLTKEHRSVFEQRVCALIFDRKVQTLDLHVKKPAKGAPREAFSARKSIPIAGSGAVAECNRSDIENRIIQSIQEKVDNDRKYLHSSICAWRPYDEFRQRDVKVSVRQRNVLQL